MIGGFLYCEVELSRCWVFGMGVMCFVVYVGLFRVMLVVSCMYIEGGFFGGLRVGKSDCLSDNHFNKDGLGPVCRESSEIVLEGNLYALIS